MYTSKVSRVFLVCMILLGAPVPQSPPAPPDNTPLTLRILPLYQFEPGTVSYRIRIQPHRDNIWFCMGWHSPNAGVAIRTSCQQLNGIYSPRVFYQDYRALTPGTYHGFVDVYHAPYYRAHTATQTFIVDPVK